MTDIGAKFRAMHQPGNPFLLANAWDQGSAKVLEGLGADAIGTTSNGHAFTLGLPDMGYVTRDQALTHAQDLVAAVKIPVSGDFENGYGDDPDTVAQTIRLAAEIGLAGCSIEDTAMGSDLHAYDFDLAVERVRAGAAAARALPHDFVFVARADGLMNGFYDIEEAIRRLQAFDKAGADCLFAPVPKTQEDLKRIVDCTDKPVNAITVGQFANVRRAEFAALGVARLSLGSGLARVIQGEIERSARKMIQDGDFSEIFSAVTQADMQKYLE